MHDHPPVRRRLAGTEDLTWIGFIALTAMVVTHLLLGHLSNGFELYKLGNQIAYAAAEQRDLENDRRSLEIERQHRTEAMDMWHAASVFGLQPAGPGQLIRVDD